MLPGISGRAELTESPFRLDNLFNSVPDDCAHSPIAAERTPNQMAYRGSTGCPPEKGVVLCCFSHEACSYGVYGVQEDSAIIG